MHDTVLQTHFVASSDHAPAATNMAANGCRPTRNAMGL